MSWDYPPDRVDALREQLLRCPVITGAGATATATIAGGVVTAITGIAGGTGFTSAPTVLLIGGDGRGATAAATVSAGAITAYEVTNGGVGYTVAPTVVVVCLGQDVERIHFPDFAMATETLPAWALADDDRYVVERSAPGESMLADGQATLTAIGYFPADLALGFVEQAGRDLAHQLVELGDGLFISQAVASRASKVRRKQTAAAAAGGVVRYRTLMLQVTVDG